jgi:hypothetical protein
MHLPTFPLPGEKRQTVSTALVCLQKVVKGESQTCPDAAIKTGDPTNQYVIAGYGCRNQLTGKHSRKASGAQIHQKTQNLSF